jgi:hypothetical protein
MMEDGQHLTSIEEIRKELQSIIAEYDQRASVVVDKEALLTLRLEQNAALTEALKKHRRVLEFMLGKPVEPEMHFGSAVLLPAFGGF